ncbi:E3 ubiquitin-protein ligase TRIM71-like isoform X1 [Oopsacas minuta]|uniref:E3 ubiquitin-protein ligase TRIM71-like isoform X1 n=1 Tax=Oopsacas minuta TaxID=111878 RepID=A0AAV7KKX1_9METZ|nr:E3 ubiquitin-protein ligase TRIM71-like isoform X1 [Oopsacas minuta]
MIRQLMETSIQQNEVVKFQKDQIKNWRKEQKKYEIATHIPIPSFYPGPRLSPRTAGEPIRRIGKHGKKKGKLYYPDGLALDGDKIYIADANNRRIQILSTEGKFIQEFGKEQLMHPYGIASFNEWVFISDLGLDAVFKFSITNYKLIKSVKGVVSYPIGLTTGTYGEVLVADSTNNRIAVFSSDLEYIREIGKDKLINPGDVKINNNKIFVADKNKINNIHIFSKSGDLLKSFIKLENGGGYICMCLDLYNNIIISDYLGNSINIFNKDGQLIQKIICDKLTGIVVNNNFDIICASDVINIY